MRIVLDTNIVLSAYLFSGTLRKVLYYQQDGRCQLLTSEFLLAELHRVLSYPKFASRLAKVNETPTSLSQQYQEITILVDVTPQNMPTICRDPDDNHVLACAIAGQAILIVSGDSDLLDLCEYEGIRIMTAADFVTLMETEGEDEP